MDRGRAESTYHCVLGDDGIATGSGHLIAWIMGKSVVWMSDSPTVVACIKREVLFLQS